MDQRLDLAVIGGTGLYRLAALRDPEPSEGDTPYAKPRGSFLVGLAQRVSHPCPGGARNPPPGVRVPPSTVRNRSEPEG